MKSVVSDVTVLLGTVRSGLGEGGVDRLLPTHEPSAVPGALGLGWFELFPGGLYGMAEMEDLDGDAATEFTFERAGRTAEHHRSFGLAARGCSGGKLMQHPQDS